MDKTLQASKVTRYEAVRRRGVEYLLCHINADGSIGPVEDGFYFYRAPWTLTVAGETRAALGVCAWIRRNMLTPKGDFDRGWRKSQTAYAYRNATLIYGAHMARQYDLSYGAMPFLLSMQDPCSGGFANDLTEEGLSDDMDIPFSVGSGLACIATGYLAHARKVYGYLKTIWDQQDDLPDRLYYNLSRKSQQVIREFAPEDIAKHIVVAQEVRHQRWTVGGIAAAFLCRLYMADPRPEYIELARHYMQFSMDSTEGQFGFAPACKSGWGSALLYQVTGEAHYRDWTYRLGDWFAETQENDGTWRRFRRNERESDQIDLVAEFVVHVDTIIGALSAGDRGALPPRR